MIPWTDDNKILIACILLFQYFIGLQWTIKVLLIPVACNVEIGYGRCPQSVWQGLFFPKIIIVRMLHVVIPCWDLIVKIFFIHIGERAKLQVPVVGVILIEGKVCIFFRCLFHISIFKTIAQAKGSIVMKVVTHPHIGRCCLLGDSF